MDRLNHQDEIQAKKVAESKKKIEQQVAKTIMETLGQDHASTDKPMNMSALASNITFNT